MKVFVHRSNIVFIIQSSNSLNPPDRRKPSTSTTNIPLRNAEQRKCEEGLIRALNILLDK